MKPVTGNATVGRFLKRAVHRDLPRGNQRGRLSAGHAAVPGHKQIESITSVAVIVRELHVVNGC